MIERGEVIKAGENITVRFNRKKECEKCNMCGFAKGSSHLDLVFKNTMGAKAGDIAEVSMAGGAVLLSSVVVYLLPLLFTACGLVLGYLIGGDGIGALFAVIFLALGFVSVSAIDKLLKRKNKKITPQLLRIIPADNSIEQE